MIEKLDFGIRQRRLRRRIRRGAIEHRHPEDARAHNAENRDQIDQTLSGSQFRTLRLAARFEDLMEDFDLPPQRVPFDLLDGVLSRLDREIGENLPLDFLSPLRRSPLLSMDHGQSECGIFLLLADRRQNSELAETNFEKCFIRIAFVVLDLDPV